MRAERVAKQGRRTRRHRRGLRVGVLLISAFLVWSVSGSVAADTPGSPTCKVRTSAGTVAYLTGAACPPVGFVSAMGYEPVLVHTSYGWRYEKPAWAGGSCSGPLADGGAFWNFGSACRTHDYGYDLVRFGRGERDVADGLFYADMRSSCARQSVTGEPACSALARWAWTTLRVGDATGFDPEPVR